MNTPFLSFAPLSPLRLLGFSARNTRAQGGGSGPGPAADDAGKDNSRGGAPSRTSTLVPGGNPTPAPVDPPLDPRDDVCTRAKWECMNHGNPENFRPLGPPPVPVPADGLVFPARPRHQQILKSKIPDTYRGQSHAECYKFCRQFKEYFDTQGIPTSNPQGIPFAGFTWSKYKNFFHEDCEFFRARQRHSKTVRKYALRLQQTRSILREYDLEGAPNEFSMIRKLRERLTNPTCTIPAIGSPFSRPLLTSAWEQKSPRSTRTLIPSAGSTNYETRTPLSPPFYLETQSIRGTKDPGSPKVAPKRTTEEAGMVSIVKGTITTSLPLAQTPKRLAASSSPSSFSTLTCYGYGQVGRMKKDYQNKSAKN